MPVFRTFLRKLGHFAFNREDSRARLQQADEIEQALRRGESVFVFPEGTFTAQPGVRPFHLGAFKAAIAAQRQIVPVALAGTRAFFATAPGCRAAAASRSRSARRSLRNRMRPIGTKSCACAMPRGK